MEYSISLAVRVAVAHLHSARAHAGTHLGGHVAQEEPPQRDGAEEQGDDAAQIQEL